MLSKKVKGYHMIVVIYKHDYKEHLSCAQSNLANSILKDPYNFDLIWSFHPNSLSNIISFF